MDPIVLSDGFGGIVDTHGIIRGILITGNPTKHPYHPPMLSLYVIRCTPHRWNIELAPNDFEIIVLHFHFFLLGKIYIISFMRIFFLFVGKRSMDCISMSLFLFFSFFKIIARSFTFSHCVYV